jgi:hypothetical protein
MTLNMKMKMNMKMNIKIHIYRMKLIININVCNFFDGSSMLMLNRMPTFRRLALSQSLRLVCVMTKNTDIYIYICIYERPLFVGELHDLQCRQVVWSVLSYIHLLTYLLRGTTALTGTIRR